MVLRNLDASVGAACTGGHPSPDLLPSIPPRVNRDLWDRWPAPHRLSHDATQAYPVGYTILLIPPSPCNPSSGRLFEMLQQDRLPAGASQDQWKTSIEQEALHAATIQQPCMHVLVHSGVRYHITLLLLLYQPQVD